MGSSTGAVYARLLRRWLAADDLPRGGSPTEVLRGMAEQRAALGLGPDASDLFEHPPSVVPVIAVGLGTSSSYFDGLRSVQDF